MIQIVEVLRRSDQGVTRPFICRGDDEQLYFVKGRGAGRRSLICEWIAGRLAKEIGLPVAPFEIVEVPEALLENPGALDLSELGAGPAFGSLRRAVMELTAAAVADVPLDVQQDVLVFDWWVRNEDRTLSENGGNPNLFWNPAGSELVVIDHNLAFDETFDVERFLEDHAFRDRWRNLAGDLVARAEYLDRFQQALKAWPEIRAAIPEEWMFADPEKTVPVDFDLDAAFEFLARCEHDDFWDTP